MNLLPDDYKRDENWKKVDDNFDRAAFVTHRNYLNFLNCYSQNLELDCKRKFQSKMSLDKKANQKVSLYKLTLKNIEEEKKNIEKYPEYSIVCCSWVPVKAYYLLLNLLVLLEYLINADSSFFVLSHNRLHVNLINLLEEGALVFNHKYFNKTPTIKKEKCWKIKPYSNVRKNITDEERYKQVIRLINKYKKEFYKDKNNIKSLKGKRKIKFEKNKSNLCEAFYWYRLKANYRDMEFVEQEVDIDDFCKFYDDYYQLSINFSNAFKGTINKVSNERLGYQLID